MYIYNETKTPYVYEGEKSTVVISRDLKIERAGEAVKTKRTHILAHETVLTENFKDEINQIVETKTPVKVSASDTVLYFSKKELVPYVTTIGDGKSTMLMATISLYRNNIRRQIVDIKHPFIYLLKGHVFKGELTVVASFVDSSQDLKIRMLEGNNIITYLFRLVDGEIQLTVEESENAEGVRPTRGFYVKNYVPTRLTESIIVMEEDIEALQAIIPEEKRHRHSIIAMTDKTMSTKIRELVASHYTAATIFVNAPEYTEEVRSQLSTILSLPVSSRLTTILIAYNTGKIERLRVTK